MICKACNRDDGKEPLFNKNFGDWSHLCAYCGAYNTHSEYVQPVTEHQPPTAPDLNHCGEIECPNCNHHFHIYADA